MNNVIESINWKADEWFTKHHHVALTKEFKGFWVSWHGIPADYGNNKDGQRKYWELCAFCLVGWNAGRRLKNYMETKHHYSKDFYGVLLPKVRPSLKRPMYDCVDERPDPLDLQTM